MNFPGIINLSIGVVDKILASFGCKWPFFLPILTGQEDLSRNCTDPVCLNEYKSAWWRQVKPFPFIDLDIFLSIKQIGHGAKMHFRTKLLI